MAVVVVHDFVALPYLPGPPGDPVVSPDDACLGEAVE